MDEENMFTEDGYENGVVKRSFVQDDSWADDQWPPRRATNQEEQWPGSNYTAERAALRTKGANGKGKGQAKEATIEAVQYTAAETFAWEEDASYGKGVNAGALREAMTSNAGGRAAADVDITQDWKLSDKDMSATAHKELTLALASIVVNHDLRLKVCESIVIHCTAVHVTLPSLVASKKETQALHVARKGWSKEQIAAQPPTYTRVYWQIVSHGYVVAKEMMEAESQGLRRFTAYYAKLQALMAQSEATLYEEIQATVRFARFRTCHNPKLAIMEVGHVGMSEEAEFSWRLTRHLLVQFFDAKVKAGVAPKSALIRRVEASLRRLKVWRNRSS
jgi:hypothetical protein